MPPKPHPITVQGKAGKFAQLLRNTRGDRPFRDIAETACVSFSYLAKVARGTGRPSWKVVESYLRACGITDPGELRGWLKEWEDAFAPGDSLTRAVRASPAYAVTYQDLITAARLLKQQAGNPPYRKIARLARLSRSTVSDFFTGKHVLREGNADRIIRVLLGHLPQEARMTAGRRPNHEYDRREWRTAIDRVYTAMQSRPLLKIF